jgi:hypothetical protein
MREAEGRPISKQMSKQATKMISPEIISEICFLNKCLLMLQKFVPGLFFKMGIVLD